MPARNGRCWRIFLVHDMLLFLPCRQTSLHFSAGSAGACHCSQRGAGGRAGGAGSRTQVRATFILQPTLFAMFKVLPGTVGFNQHIHLLLISPVAWCVTHCVSCHYVRCALLPGPLLTCRMPSGEMRRRTREQAQLPPGEHITWVFAGPITLASSASFADECFICLPSVRKAV